MGLVGVGGAWFSKAILVSCMYKDPELGEREFLVHGFPRTFMRYWEKRVTWAGARCVSFRSTKATNPLTAVSEI